MPDLEILADASLLADRAAELFVRMAEESIRARGRFHVALAGGSTPRALYVRLAESPFSSKMDWQHVHFFWGDERCVPPTHVDSNYRMVRETLLDCIPLPVLNIHRIQGELPPQEAAFAYEQELDLYFGEGIPRFDLILLGLGEDGHTASLFPGSDALHETHRRVVPVIHHDPPPPLVDRLTLTPVVLNAAATVIFLVSGAGKAGILSRVLHGPSQPDRFPAQAVQPVDGSLLWLVDRDAASQLTLGS